MPPQGRRPSQQERDEPASLLQPEGTYGPTFLTLTNYFVIKEYNFSDLYVLFVGHLADRIGDPRPFETPWSKNTQLRSTQVEAMQHTLTKLGLYKDKLDGKAGMLTRAALGHYQKTHRLQGRLLADAVGARSHAGARQELNLSKCKTRRRWRVRRGISDATSRWCGVRRLQ